jgi:hypothetical protein
VDDPRTAIHMYDWMCSGIPSFYGVATSESCPDNVDRIQNDAVAGAWRLGDKYCGADDFCHNPTWPVEYCLSEAAEPHCKLHVEPTIAILVTVLNFGKNLIFQF